MSLSYLNYCLKKIIALFGFIVLASGILVAQDDELPPPSSKPRQNQEKREYQKPPDVKDFKGFTKPQKFDISKLLIEPIVNLSISQYRLDIGFAPSVGYRVFQPKKANPKWGNIGLFIGGGVTYFYSGITTNAPRGGLTRVSLQTYGAGPLIHYTIWRGLFVRTKLELLARRMPVGMDYVNNTFVYSTKFTPAWLIGAGYNLLQSKNIFVPLIVSYDLLHSVVSPDYSIYPRGFTVQLGFITLF